MREVNGRGILQCDLMRFVGLFESHKCRKSEVTKNRTAYVRAIKLKLARETSLECLEINLQSL